MSGKHKFGIRDILRELTPPLVWKSAGSIAKKIFRTPPPVDTSLQKNTKLKDIHAGKRIFILGTGPSIKEQNLLSFKNEICIGLNEFHLHQDFNSIKPQYMVFSGFSLHPEIMNKALDWYRNFEQHIQKISTAILNVEDKPFLEKHQLLNETEKYFVSYSKPIEELKNLGLQPDKFSYYSQNVSIMALQMALYMGASEIFLLGCDHDWILTALDNRQNHFYTDKQSIIYKNQETEVKRDIFNDLINPYYIMFQQYRAIKEYAEQRGRSKIYNASKRSLLDVFEKKTPADVPL